VNNAGYRYLGAGQNVGYARTAEEAVKQLYDNEAPGGQYGPNGGGHYHVG
jgi:hypothetical protein